MSPSDAKGIQVGTNIKPTEGISADFARCEFNLYRVTDTQNSRIDAQNSLIDAIRHDFAEIVGRFNVNYPEVSVESIEVNGDEDERQCGGDVNEGKCQGEPFDIGESVDGTRDDFTPTGVKRVGINGVINGGHIKGGGLHTDALGAILQVQKETTLIKGQVEDRVRIAKV